MRLWRSFANYAPAKLQFGGGIDAKLEALQSLYDTHFVRVRHRCRDFSPKASRRRRRMLRLAEGLRVGCRRHIYPPQQGSRSLRWSSATQGEWSEQHGN